ncbi:Abscisic acid G-protein coupled receptor-domain-containing protein [Cubamyces menziesii]|nr:Abscisic acid G-protein coupled receptor-domain-containing protein [Cubamyces menziesii]
MSQVYNVQSAGLLVIRAALFYACRRYLLRNLYHDLQDLSAKAASDSGAPVTVVFDSGDTELDTLPTSATSPTSVSATSRKRPFHSALSRALFALCFSETCMLFLLLILQALDLSSPIVRLIHWRISLAVLLVAIVLGIPLSYSIVLSNGSNPGVSPASSRVISPRLGLYLIPNVLFLLALSYIPIPAGMQTHSILASTLSRLTVIGTVFLGLLSGFGAIDTAWDFFPVFSRTSRPHPTDEEVRTAESGLQRVREDLTQRRKDLRALEASKQPDAQSNWFSKTVLSWSGDSESSALAKEISGLEALEYEMSRSLEALKQRQAHAKFSKTLAGRVFNWGGRLFSLYCVYRIVTSLVNLIIPRSPPATPGESAPTNADVISFVLAYLLSHLPFVQVPADKIAVISRQISLGFVGIIILSSIRRVLRGVARLLRVTSRSLGASLMLLTLAQVMGIYLMATLIQLRTSFPPPPARPDVDADEGIVNLFSTLPEYQFFGPLFDGSFLLAAAATGAVRWLGDRVLG